MNNKNSVRCLAIFFLMLLVACGSKYELEYFTKVESNKSPLALGLYSYMSLDEVKKKLSIESNEIVIIDKNVSAKRDSIPPFNILTVKIPDNEIEGFKGSVLIKFFNGRLMEVRFFPVRIDEFVRNISGLTHSNEIEIRPFTRVWFAKDYHYVGWVDTRIQEQFYTWIKNYS